jgi:drug/metabolite transporter (DMT)-like permease
LLSTVPTTWRLLSVACSVGGVIFTAWASLTGPGSAAPAIALVAAALTWALYQVSLTSVSIWLVMH